MAETYAGKDRKVYADCPKCGYACKIGLGEKERICPACSTKFGVGSAGGGEN